MEKIKQLIKTLQEKGLPIVILQDPITKLPSITYSFLVVSGVLVVLGLIGKSVKLVGGVDIDNSLSFFYGCSGLYLGRKITNGKSTIDSQEKK